MLKRTPRCLEYFVCCFIASALCAENVPNVVNIQVIVLIMRRAGRNCYEVSPKAFGKEALWRYVLPPHRQLIAHVARILHDQILTSTASGSLQFENSERRVIFGVEALFYPVERQIS